MCEGWIGCDYPITLSGLWKEMRFNMLFDIILLKYPLIVFIATGFIIKLNKNVKKIVPKESGFLNKRKDKQHDKKRISFQRVFILALKLLLGWFIFSFISTFLICVDSHDGFCGLAILGFLGEPLIFFADILATLQLYKLPFLLQIVSALKEVGFALLVGLWVLSWIFIAWVYLKIKDNIGYFMPNKDIMKIFLFLFFIFGPISFLCSSNWDYAVDDAKYCPPSGSHSSQERVPCDDPRYQGGKDNQGNCIISSGGTDYDCLLCKYPSIGPTLFKFRKPGTELGSHFYIFLLLLVFIEYLLSCWLYHKKIKRLIPIMVTIVIICISLILLFTYLENRQDNIKKIKNLECESISEEKYADECYIQKSKFAVETDEKIQICYRILNEEKTNQCLINVAINSSDIKICNQVFRETNIKENCYISVDKCLKTQEVQRVDCYTNRAIEAHNNDFCVNLKNSEQVNKCFFRYATELGNSNACRQISNPELMKSCITSIN